MRKLFLAVMLSCIPTMAQAQQHPCDVNVGNSGQAVTGQVLIAYFCVLATDTIEAAVIRSNGVPVDLGPVTTQTGPNASGYKQVAVNAGQYLTGNYTLTMSVYNHNSITGALQESAQSSPFALSVLPVTTIPATPTRLIIVGQ